MELPICSLCRGDRFDIENGSDVPLGGIVDHVINLPTETVVIDSNGFELMRDAADRLVVIE